MGWYRGLEAKLSGYDEISRLALVAVIVFCVFLLLQPSASMRAAGALWLIMP